MHPLCVIFDALDQQKPTPTRKQKAAVAVASMVLTAGFGIIGASVSPDTKPGGPTLPYIYITNQPEGPSITEPAPPPFPPSPAVGVPESGKNDGQAKDVELYPINHIFDNGKSGLYFVIMPMLEIVVTTSQDFTFIQNQMFNK